MTLIKTNYLGQLENSISFSYLVLLIFFFAKLLIFFGKFILVILEYSITN